MRRLICVFGILSVLLTACSSQLLPQAQDIDTIALMRTMALDAGEQGGVMVTLSSGIRSGGSDGQPKPPIILNQEADTVFAACQTMRSTSDNALSLGHLSECIVGQALAEQGVEGLLDYMERSYDMRLNGKLFVSRDIASELLQATASETSAATDRLEALTKNQPLQSGAWKYTALDFLTDMADNQTALVPLVTLRESDEGGEITPDGLCWFSAGKLAGMLDQTQTQAAGLLTQNAGNEALELTLSKGKTAGLRLISVDSHWTPQWEGDQLTGLTVKLTVRTDLAEVQGDIDPYDENSMKALEKELSQKIKEDTEALLTLTQTEGDFLHLQRKLRGLCPLRRNEVDAHWTEWFPQLNIKVQVSGKIRRSYDVNRGEESV